MLIGVSLTDNTTFVNNCNKASNTCAPLNRCPKQRHNLNRIGIYSEQLVEQQKFIKVAHSKLMVLKMDRNFGNKIGTVLNRRSMK